MELDMDLSPPRNVRSVMMSNVHKLMEKCIAQAVPMNLKNVLPKRSGDLLDKASSEFTRNYERALFQELLRVPDGRVRRHLTARAFITTFARLIYSEGASVYSTIGLIHFANFHFGRFPDQDEIEDELLNASLVIADCISVALAGTSNYGNTPCADGLRVIRHCIRAIVTLDECYRRIMM